MNREKRMVPFMPNNGMPLRTKTYQRNALCECGSGKKQKKCSGVETRFINKI